MNEPSNNPASPEQTITLPSLEILSGAIANELETVTNHVESLDTKAGVILGFAGVLAGLAVSRGELIARIGLLCDVLAGLFAVSAFMPRKWPVLRAERLRNKYLTSPVPETLLYLLDTKVAMVEEAATLLQKKGRLIKLALILLTSAIFLIVFGSIIKG